MNRYNTKPAPTFSKQELDKRISKAQARYDKYRLVETYSLPEFLTELSDLEAEGFVLDSDFPAMASALAYGFQFMARLVKPKKVMTAELSEITAQVTAAYSAELEAETQHAIDLMAIRLVAEEKAKQAKDEEEEMTKRMAAARVEAAEILGVAL